MTPRVAVGEPYQRRLHLHGYLYPTLSEGPLTLNRRRNSALYGWVVNLMTAVSVGASFTVALDEAQEAVGYKSLQIAVANH